MEKIKNYYKVTVKLGHLGCGNSTTALIYYKATSAYKAMKKAQNLPAVKHNNLPIQVKMITEEEYLNGINSADYYEKISML